MTPFRLLPVDALDRAQAFYEKGEIVRAAKLLQTERGRAIDVRDDPRLAQIEGILSQMRGCLSDEQRAMFERHLLEARKPVTPLPIRKGLIHEVNELLWLGAVTGGSALAGLLAIVWVVTGKTAVLAGAVIVGVGVISLLLHSLIALMRAVFHMFRGSGSKPN